SASAAITVSRSANGVTYSSYPWRSDTSTQQFCSLPRARRKCIRIPIRLRDRRASKPNSRRMRECAPSAATTRRARCCSPLTMAPAMRSFSQSKRLTRASVNARTPAVSAAVWKSRLSRYFLRMPRPQIRRPFARGNGASTDRLSKRYRTPRNGAPPTTWLSPSRSRTPRPAGIRPSPHGFSLGKMSRSKSSTEMPLRPSRIASAEPATPPPHIKTSAMPLSYLRRLAETQFPPLFAKDNVKFNSHRIFHFDRATRYAYGLNRKVALLNCRASRVMTVFERNIHANWFRCAMQRQIPIDNPAMVAHGTGACGGEQNLRKAPAIEDFGAFHRFLDFGSHVLRCFRV